MTSQELYMLANLTTRRYLDRCLSEDTLRMDSEDTSVQTIGKVRLKALTEYINVTKTSSTLLNPESIRMMDNLKTELMPTNLTVNMVNDGLVNLLAVCGTDALDNLADIFIECMVRVGGASLSINKTVIKESPWLIFAMLTKLVDLRPEQSVEE